MLARALGAGNVPAKQLEHPADSAGACAASCAIALLMADSMRIMADRTWTH